MSKSQKNVIFTSPITALAEGQKTSDVEVLRVGIIQDRDLEITAEMLADFVKNHEANVYGCELQVNLSHFREGEAAGWIKKLFIEGDSLYMTVEWTELGIDKITKKLFQFVSAEFTSSYPHAETGENVRNVFLGAALTNTPALKYQTPIELTEQQKDLLIKTRMIKKYIADLKARTKLSEEDVKLARTMLAEASAEEQAELKPEVDALETKQAEDKKAEEAEKQELAELRKTKGAGETVSLAEFNALKEKAEKAELREMIGNTLTLSETVKTGFRKEDVDVVAGFMAKLSEEQRGAFVALMGKVQHVDLSTIGGKGANAHGGKIENTEELSEEDQEKVATLAEKLLSEKKANSYRDAFNMALSELSKK